MPTSSSSAAPDRRWTAHAAALAAPVAAAIVVHGGALGTWFAHDDVTFVARARGLVPGGGAFRALSETAAFRLEYAAFGLDPFGYHATNFALHLLAVGGVYALAWLLLARRGVACAAALVFAVTSIAFTPLHAATGVSDLLVAVLLLAATCVHVLERRAGRVASWWAAVPALAAAFAKETALAWPLVVLALEWRAGFARSRRALLPALAAVAVFVAVLVASGSVRRIAGSPAYAVDPSPAAIAGNLFTYVRWCVALGEPIRDARAAADPAAWWWGAPIGLAALALFVRGRGPAAAAAAIGAAWWLAFVAPVLPFTRHAYLYYLYVPWAGGAIAVAAWGAVAFDRLPRRARAIVAAAVLAALVAVEARSVAERERRTQDALPVDRTLRDAMLLEHAVAGVRAARLPDGARVGFVNPEPRRRFDLVTGAPTRGDDLARRTSYLPLEVVMQGGLTLRLFFPRLGYAGFATTIPAGWTDVDCFLFEQRGWLVHWGRGSAALARQQAWLARAGAESDSALASP